MNQLRNKPLHEGRNVKFRLAIHVGCGTLLLFAVTAILVLILTASVDKALYILKLGAFISVVMTVLESTVTYTR